MYHQTKFGCQGTNSSVNIAESQILIIWALSVTLTLKIATTIKQFLHDSGSCCCITIPNLVTKCSAVQKISSGQTFTDILNLNCDRGLEPNNPIFPQDTLADDALLSNQVWLQTDQSSFDYISLHCDLDTEESELIFFCTTLWLMMMHHHTKFGNKMLGILAGINWTNLNWHFETSLWPWPWRQ